VNGVKRTVLAIVVLATSLIWLRPGPFAAPPAAQSPADIRARDEQLAGARVFRDAPFDARAIDFAKDPNERLIDPHLTTCTFVPTEVSGTTPKFDCRLDSGHKIKVKYGWTREIPVEVVVTRLLDALGFGADRMSRVATLRCFGCVISPFHIRAVAQFLHLGEAFDRHLPYDHSIDFENVTVERKFTGDAVEAGGTKGWDFSELSKIDPARGGASRAEVDALRLMAVFLNHWDNKASNQRLVCPSEKKPCEHALLMLQDTGSDLGPYKMNLDHWRKRPIWSDDAACGVSMKGLPFDGATFADVRISESGRRLLADRLSSLSDAQIHTLFAAGGFENVDGWAAAFEDKVRQIAARTCAGT
jgi:hypothetical protein